MLSACGASTNEWTRLCVSVFDGKGWSILNEPEPFDNEPHIKVLPIPSTSNLVVSVPFTAFILQALISFDPEACQLLATKSPLAPDEYLHDRYKQHIHYQ